jgi:tRNA dimethylallyltransferase
MVNPIVCLMGPTASGKTAIACEWVREFPFEIISIDSAMIYRDMNIGTAKPDLDTLHDAPHHLIDIVDPIEAYSAARCIEDVTRCVELILKKGKIPLLVGGTMMYFRALQQGLSELPEANEAIREDLLKEVRVSGWDELHARLVRLDPESGARIHPHDTQRILRALEVHAITGRSLTSCLQEGKQQSPYSFINLMLIPKDRSWLHERINLRFEHMLSHGLIDEVKMLVEKWGVNATHPSMRCVGYRQVLDYLAGHETSASLLEKGTAATRQLAKRQLTWLRHWAGDEGQLHTFFAENPNEGGEMLAVIRQILDNWNIDNK